MLLGLYDSAADETRVAAFLALRKLAIAADHSLRETVIKVSFFPSSLLSPKAGLANFVCVSRVPMRHS